MINKTLPSFLQLAFVMLFLVGSHASFSQGRGNPGKKEKKEIPKAALEHIKKNKEKLKLKDKEIADLELSSETRSKKSGVRHIYLKQTHEGIEIHGAITNINMTKDGKVINMGDRFQNDVDRKVNATQPGIDAADAVAAAARHLNTSVKEPLSVIEKEDANNKEVLFTTGGISLEPISAKLVYQPWGEGELRLAWEVSIYELDAQNWWNIRVDAHSGEFLDKDNLVVHCQFENNGSEGAFLHANHGHTASVPALVLQEEVVIPYAPEMQVNNKGKASGLYEVYPMPVESPNHGNRKPVNEKSAADRVASPDGWHTAGAASYTITRGNNVYAYEDPDNTGFVASNIANPPHDIVYGYSPDGGTQRNFKFPVDFSQEPGAYRDAAITNLFYWNNITHDVWYQYGFDEESGNFQANNFGRGGKEGDHVMAEAQDSRNLSTRNNANFSTPVDGRRPRMQMYLWSRPDADMFQVVSPSSISGTYSSAGATFGPALTPEPLTGKLALAISGESNLACEEITNPEAISGNIAVLYRGACSFVQKVENAQAAGAIAVVVINNQPGLTTMGGGERAEFPINIPAVMITQEAGASILEVMEAGQDVSVALKNDPDPDVDSDFDNGIIVHEYGHGISIRLTAGPDIVTCLSSQVRLSTGQIIATEQMGEGWSDWFGLIMTMKPGDTPEKIRGIGTYANGEPTDGLGIRPAPYSTDFSVNSYTYAATNNPALSAPHGVGFVWATALWDMTWDLIDQYGFDEDLYNGNGGNNIAMHLVIEGLKLQPCYPGFVDGRDAILLADELLYDGANKELIWRAFARRGVGFSADQGLGYYRFDQTEAFDLPAGISAAAPATATAKLSLKAVPNPFSSSTKIEFTTKDAGNYRLEIRNGEGILLMVLAEGYSQAGELHSLDFSRGKLHEGLYVARLVTDKESVISRIVLGK